MLLIVFCFTAVSRHVNNQEWQMSHNFAIFDQYNISNVIKVQQVGYDYAGTQTLLKFLIGNTATCSSVSQQCRNVVLENNVYYVTLMQTN